jgi:hypothetical protein
MHDRLDLKLTQCLDAVQYPLARVFVNRCRREFRLADAYCRCHNKHRFRAKCVRFVLIQRTISEAKNELRQRRSEDSASKEVTAEKES